MALTPDAISTHVARTPFDRTAKPQANLKETFHRYFQDEVKNVQEHIQKLVLTALVAADRQDVIDYCLASISRLETEVQDAYDFIPAYDQRSYRNAIDGLKEKFREARLRFAPKSRFAFKIRKNDSALSLIDVAAAESEKDTATMQSNAPPLPFPPSMGQAGEIKNYNEEISSFRGPIRAPSFSKATSVTISQHEGVHIILPASASHATSSGSLTNLKRCIVDMSVPTASGAPFAGLALKNISQSLMIAGQVAGAAHITGLKNCVVVVDSRQVRMHNCENVDIYLRCTSKPIIEDCNAIRFAPLPSIYKSRGEEHNDDQWNRVQDFKWLKQEQSPNWSILPAQDMLEDMIWKDIVPGAPGKGTEDILKEVGIGKYLEHENGV